VDVYLPNQFSRRARCFLFLVVRFLSVSRSHVIYYLRDVYASTQ
jgi:hypothetical protein